MTPLSKLKKEMRMLGISNYFDALSPFAKNSLQITLNVKDDNIIPIGSSKFGGLPDLPNEVEWFYTEKENIPMSFIAQINFSETIPYDIEHKLPEHGILYFFYDCSPTGMSWGFDPEDADGFKVYFYDGDMSTLSRRETPKDFFYEDNGIVFESAQLNFEAKTELPSLYSDLTANIDLPDDEDTEDAYYDWLDEKNEEPPNKLLGHSDNIQNGMELECEYVTNGIYCGTSEGYKAGRLKGLDKNASRWTLLMQVESNDDLGMMWGDAGRLYLWITNEDLDARCFDKSWLILQCG